MINGKCKSCKFWTRRIRFNMPAEYIKKFEDIIETIEEESPATSYKFIIVPSSPMGICDNNNFIYTAAGGCSYEELPTALKNREALLYSDGEAYQAYFYTTEGFGCIHHKNK